MYSKLITTGAAVAALAGVANAVPFNMERAGGSAVVRPATHTKVLQPENPRGDSAEPDVDLKDEENLVWGNGNSMASFKGKVNGKTRKIVHTGRMNKLISSIECPNNSPMVVHFENEAAMKKVQERWSWLEDDAKKSMVFVVDHAVCGGANGRRPFLVNNVNYKNNAASMKAVPVQWEDVLEDGHVRIQSNARKLPGQSKIGGSGSLPVGKTFDQDIFSTNFKGVDLALKCSQCGTQGSLDYDIDVGLIDGVTGSITAQDSLGLDFGVGVSASGELTDAYTADITFATIPLEGIAIPGLADIGPEIAFGGQAGISAVSAEVEATVGVSMTIPDGTKWDLSGDDDSSDWSPEFHQIGPTISGSVSVEASVSPVITFSLSATVLGKGMSAGIGLSAPKFDVTCTASASSDGGQCDNNGVAGVSIDGSVGVELDVFAGFSPASDEPNKVSIYQKDFPVFSGCVSIGGGNSTSSKRSLHY